MDEIYTGCSHQGWGLWVNHWEMWCGLCGVTERFPQLINFLKAHKRGEPWRVV